VEETDLVEVMAVTPREKAEAQVEILDALARWSEGPDRPAEVYGIVSSVDLRLRAVALLAEAERFA
jgi:hypothetical protein